MADTPPPAPGHDGVMEDVQEGDLAMFLAQHKEHLSKANGEQDVS